MALAAAGSFFNALGWLLCSEACINGIAGPAQALIEMQCIWQLLIEVVLHQHIPNVFQFIGMAIAITGSVIMALDLSIFDFMWKKRVDTDFVHLK